MNNSPEIVDVQGPNHQLSKVGRNVSVLSLPLLTIREAPLGFDDLQGGAALQARTAICLPWAQCYERRQLAIGLQIRVMLYSGSYAMQANVEKWPIHKKLGCCNLSNRGGEDLSRWLRYNESAIV